MQDHFQNLSEEFFSRDTKIGKFKHGELDARKRGFEITMSGAFTREKLAQASWIKSISIAQSMTIKELYFGSCHSDGKMNLTLYKSNRGTP